MLTQEKQKYMSTKDLYMNVHSSLIHNSQKRSKCPSKEDGTRTLWYIHLTQCYRTMKRITDTAGGTVFKTLIWTKGVDTKDYLLDGSFIEWPRKSKIYLLEWKSENGVVEVKLTEKWNEVNSWGDCNVLHFALVC